MGLVYVHDLYTASLKLIFRHIEDFEILHGDLHGLPDTMAFLKSLSSLHFETDSGKGTEKRLMRERAAAAALFDWEVLI